MMTTPPLIMLPGMGADSRMFAPLQSEIPQLVTPEWIEPNWNESIGEYARRLAEVVDPGQPCFVGGASFGGVVALELASLINAQTCFLISSMRCPSGLSRRLRAMRPLTSMIGLLPWFAPIVTPAIGVAFGSSARKLTELLVNNDSHFLRWAAKAVVSWKPSPAASRVRVLQLHGDRDRIFPIHRTKPDWVISGGGHVLTVTHPLDAAEFLISGMNSNE